MGGYLAWVIEYFPQLMGITFALFIGTLCLLGFIAAPRETNKHADTFWHDD